MELRDFLAHVGSGALIAGGSEHHQFMHDAAQQAFRLTTQIDNGYRTPDEVGALLAELIGKPVDASVAVFPPFTASSARTSPWAEASSSTSAAASKTPEATPSATAPSSDTAAP